MERLDELMIQLKYGYIDHEEALYLMIRDCHMTRGEANDYIDHNCH